MRSDWTFPLTSSKERLRINGSKLHSTQKPTSLLYRILLTSTNPGDIVLDPFFGSGTTGTVAKMLHRNWIGIEREKKYIKAAQTRIDSVEPLPLESLCCEDRQRPKRIPFGLLIECGLLSPGQLLWNENGKIKATVLSNGKIKCKDKIDTIHGMAKSLTNTPANGWDYWFFEDANGVKKSIDELRAQIRNETGL
jgi:modification methylase